MQCKVWNDSDFTWKEMFKNQEIVIPPHGYIMMNRDDAVDFEGKFSMPRVDTNRQIMPESEKRIRVEGAYGPHLYEKQKVVKVEADTVETEDAPKKRGRPPKNVSESV
jgi:hypothetical protein